MYRIISAVHCMKRVFWPFIISGMVLFLFCIVDLYTCFMYILSEMRYEQNIKRKSFLVALDPTNVYVVYIHYNVKNTT